MSEKGQTEKNSVRVYVFRFAHKLGHRSMQSACLQRANSSLRGPFGVNGYPRAQAVCPFRRLIGQR
jgi:hypothetical protein